MNPLDVGFATCSDWHNDKVIWDTIWLSKLGVVNGCLDQWDLIISGDHGQLVLVEPDSLLTILDPGSDKHAEVELLDISDEVVVE